MEKLINSHFNQFQNEKQKTLKALVLGSTGAIGRELVTELCKSPGWDEVSVIVRRELDQWQTMEGKHKLKVIKLPSLDALENTAPWKFDDYQTVFCCLGGRTKEGKEQFTKTDYTYPLYSAQIASQNKIPHFSLLTSIGADHKSLFLYSRVKGQIEEAVKGFNFPVYSIFRPGLLLNRDNDDRFIEKVAQYIPFFPKIESKDMAKAMRIEAELHHFSGKLSNQILEICRYENKQILNLLKEQLKK